MSPVLEGDPALCIAPPQWEQHRSQQTPAWDRQEHPIPSCPLSGSSTQSR